MKNALAGVLAMLVPAVAAASPLFDAHLKAKQTSDGIEVFVFLANHSHRSACYFVMTPPITTRYRDGASDVLLSTNEPSWENGPPPPAPIQFVPPDDSTRGYAWITLPPSHSNTVANAPISVETTIELYDCRDLFSDKPVKYHALFEATLTATIDH